MKIALILTLSLLAFSSLEASASFLEKSPKSLRLWADLFLATSVTDPEELRDPALFSVTREFGPSTIAMSQLPIRSLVAEANQKPWSSWWFPKFERDLFDDTFGTSPLEKYDLVRSTMTGQESKASEWEKKQHNPDVPRWEGLCDAWAVASISNPEPVKERTLKLNGGFHKLKDKRVTFSVSDQKALLLKTFEALPQENVKHYGQRFQGDFDGWIFPDIFPQELHRFVEVMLFERKQAFVMDHDPGVEVWSEPVFKANYQMEPVPENPNAVFVKLWLYSAAPIKQKADKERVGTKEIVREYNYFLYGKRDAEGNLMVETGVWAKGNRVDSRRDHPDFVFVVAPREQLQRASYNLEVEPRVVDRILTRMEAR